MKSNIKPHEPSPYSLLVVQDEIIANSLPLNCMKLLCFNEASDDEIVCTESAAMVASEQSLLHQA